MRQFIILIGLILFFSCKGEKASDTIEAKTKIEVGGSSIDSTYIATKTRHFTLADTIITGEGYALLKNIISNSQFIMFGERHGSKVTSELIAALIPILHKEGFNHTAFEVGPYAAKKLMTLSSPPSATVENLKIFTSKYALEEDHQVPIPFFDGLEDAYFLRAIRERNMNIWGLDQEYYSSTLFFIDEFLSLAKNDTEYLTIKSEKEKVSKIITSWYTKDNLPNSNIKLFEEIQKDSIVTQYLNRFREKENTKKMVQDLEMSWDIYTRWRDDSHADRISYMRTNFLSHYNKALETEANPKVFLKFGNLHASKIMTNRCYDLGNLITEIATKNDSKATIINSWHRYFNTNGIEEDYLKKYPLYFNRLRDFMIQAKRDQWTIIDLESIRKDIELGHVTLPTNGDYHRIKNLIEGYDYQLILPVDSKITPNRTEVLNK
ncbi:hypothetical protein [Aquimarina sediminis]|uniref:hypothetical protein n=1 Tax=Aquimarina sediminis TaxID=2070536 RepID=UPI000CA02FBB|nr:hypothetical protein [Aquimarina sediminis]